MCPLPEVVGCGIHGHMATWIWSEEGVVDMVCTHTYLDIMTMSC